MSKIKLESSSNAGSREEATVRWRAPETFSREYARVKDNVESQGRADIYSLGVIIWELFAAKQPYEGQKESEVVRLLTAGTRMTIPGDWPAEYRQLIEDCWKLDPKQRPSAVDILAYTKKHWPQYSKQPPEGL